METKTTPGSSIASETDVDQFLNSVPSTDAICERIEQIDREKKSLKKLLRIAQVKAIRQGVTPCV